jgi:hypothetical protein
MKPNILQRFQSICVGSSKYELIIIHFSDPFLCIISTRTDSDIVKFSHAALVIHIVP